jgi:hydrogenase maturation protease
MNVDASYGGAERLARALMFEGYILYPYRRSSLKNMQRFAFGSLLPRTACTSGTSDASTLRLECLVRGSAPAAALSVRFLHYVQRVEPGEPEPWIEAVERACEIDQVALAELEGEGTKCLEREIGGESSDEAGVVREQLTVRVRVSLTSKRLDARLSRLRIDVENASEGNDLLHALGAVHVLLRADAGSSFVSLLEPPRELAEHALACCNRGCFPVLAGEPGEDRVLLASPIILYDRPVIAPESAGDFCDATEIDEMLSLRVLTLTDDERREALRTDAKSRAIIERTHAQSEGALLALHGAQRMPVVALDTLEPPRLASPLHAFSPGEAVRLRPKPGGDVFDLALAGEQATIASVEEDFEGRVHYAVTVDADPGRDLGASGMPGHRFFFSAEELERVS